MMIKKIVFPLSLAFGIAAGAQAAGPSPGASALVVGGGLGLVPEYSGADDEHAIPLINVDYQDSSGFFAGVLRGIGYTTTAHGLSMSGAVTYDAGRDDKKHAFRSGSDDLRGMGKIKGAALGSIRIGFDAGPVTLSAGADLALSDRDRGNTYQLGATMPVMVNASNQVSVGLMAKYRDDKNMQTYFGVNPQQSANSGYKTYRAGAGFESVSLSVNWNRVIDKSWSFYSTAGVARLTGNAADSPLARRRSSPVLLGMLNYRF